MARESNQYTAVLNFLKKHKDCLGRKRWNGKGADGRVYGTTGDPDIYGSLVNGTHFELELKQKGKKPEPLQLVRLEEWEQAGALTAWFDNYPEAIAWLQGHIVRLRNATSKADQGAPDAN